MTFKQEAELILADYPNFHLIEKQGRCILKGIIDIKSKDSETLGSFSVEIAEKEGYPYRFPTLFEIGGDIPTNANWHKYPDDSCCITILPDEILKCKNGMTLKCFIEEHAKAYLANHLYRVKNNYYLNGEYSHNNTGYCEFYAKLFGTNDKLKWREIVNIAFLEKDILGRNESCFCGSSKKYKVCHHLMFKQIRALGKNYIINDLNNLL